MSHPPWLGYSVLSFLGNAGTNQRFIAPNFHVETALVGRLSSIQLFHHSMGLNSVSVVAEHEVFWGEIAPTEHVVHLYSTEKAFGDLLDRFVAGGLHTY